MPKGYWVVHLDVTDVAAYQRYREFVQPFLAANGGRFLIRGGAQEVTEGAVKARTVIVEWPTTQRARHITRPSIARARSCARPSAQRTSRSSRGTRARVPPSA
jgi:uncharacterized protein (DUF1330 family)